MSPQFAENSGLLFKTKTEEREIGTENAFQHGRTI